MLWVLIFGPGLVLFMIPCLLSWRWLGVYAVLAGAGLAFLWQNSLAHRGEGNGVAEAFGLMMLYGITAAVGAGIAARALMLGLRGRRIRWRYAWLPAPVILGTLIATPSAMEWYQDWKRRPPSDACLAAAHPITLAEHSLRIPMAPVFVMFGRDEADRIYSLNLPSSARSFCARATKGAMAVRLLWLKFEPAILKNSSIWPRALCDTLGSRPWLLRLCSPEIDPGAEHYPQRLVLQSIEDAKRDGGYRDLAAALQSGTFGDSPRLRRLETAEGPMILFCGGGTAMCLALFEPLPGLAAGFEFVAADERGAQEALAIHAKAMEILADLFGRE